MSTGSLALTLALLAAGAPSSDVIPMNTRNFKIPVQIGEGQRDKIKELILFASSDQGVTWNEVGVLAPDQDGFKFFAPSDGLYWFNICLVDIQGKRQPPDIYKAPPREKVLVDTLKPGVRIVSADRQADEIVVKWEIQEDHPDLSTLKLEYRTPDAPAYMWYSAPIQPAMTGQTSFQFINSGPVTLRLKMMDIAGNVGIDQKEIVAKAMSFVATPPAPTTLTPAPAANMAQANPAASMAPTNGSAGAALPQPDLSTLAPQQTQQPSATQGSAAPAAVAPPAAPFTPAAPAPAFAGSTATPPPVPYQNRNLAGSNYESMRPMQQTMNQPEPRNGQDRAWGPPAMPNNQPANSYGSESESRYINPLNQGGPMSQSMRPAMSRWPGAPVAPLQLTNTPQVTLDYEVTKVGPSGVGRVALYLTKDDGRTWEPFGEDADLKPPMTANLPGEGIYGLRLVVTSRAGLGGRPPQLGDLPQMRIEVDTTPPATRLFYPQPDPSRRDALILTWSASDRSLAPNPITLQWAERPDGVWNNIATDLTNTGRYVWQLAPNMPYRVYLRVTARDLAGNVGVDESPEPVLIDLHEPEGQLLGISGSVRRP
jgi:hypothetical protein